jgi:hypothetical protein
LGSPNNKNRSSRSQLVPINRAADVEPEFPHDDDAERSVLSAIILDNRAIKIPAESLKPTDFFTTYNQRIFSAMLELSGRGDPIEPLPIIDLLESGNQKLDPEFPAYISGLPDGVPRVTNPGNIKYYCDKIRQKSILRQVANSATAIYNCALGPESKLGNLGLYTSRLSLLLFAPLQPESTLAIPDMPERVLDGKLGEICETRLSGLPISYAWVSLVTVAGALVPPSQVRTNMYACPVGPIGSGKSQAIERATATLGLTKPQLENTLAGSFEGLAEKLNVAGDARLLSPDELGHLLLKARIDGASFPFVLNSAFYKTEFEVLAARGKKINVNARLGIIGGIVEDKFPALFGSATTGGLYDRFIFGRCPQPFQYDYRPFEGVAERTGPCTVTIAGDVWELKTTWLKEIPGLTARTAELAIRVGAIAAAFSGRSILYAKAIEKTGRAFAEYQARFRAAFRPNPGENTDAQCAWDIRSWLTEHPGWNPKRTVYRGINAYRFGPAAFERCIAAMVAGGEMDIDSGRPARLRLVE